MLKDIIFLSLGAVFGLGVALMTLAAPLYFKNAPVWVWHWLFWGGLVLMALMVADSITLLLGGRKIISLGPALLVNIGLSFIATAIIWQTSSEFFSSTDHIGKNKSTISTPIATESSNTRLIIKEQNYTRSLRAFSNQFYISNEQIALRRWNQMNEIKDFDQRMRFREETFESDRERMAQFSGEFLQNYRPEALKLYTDMMAALSQIGIIPPKTGIQLAIPGLTDMDVLISGPRARYVDDTLITRLADKLDSLAALFPASDQILLSISPPAASPPSPAQPTPPAGTSPQTSP